MTGADLASMGAEIAHFFGHRSYIKETRIKGGLELTQHKHEHDHLAYLVSGQALLLLHGEVQALKAPCCLLLKAHTYHGVRALTDVVWLCVWGTDATDAETVDAHLIEASQ
jgi:quercetin dioxygenase-like cupin family protein